MSLTPAPTSLHDPRALHSEPDGKTDILKSAILTFTPLPVGGVYPGRTDLDPHLTGSGMGSLDLDYVQYVGAAILVELNRLHLCAPSIAASIDTDEPPIASEP